ncbi:MAG: GGDEF domain-containing protein [Treponema sp.]|nr:GGDEF domain-containing protein [Treponema sp.]
MKKFNISLEKAKIISTILVSIIFMSIVLSISGLYTKKMLKKAENEYFNALQTTVNGFSRIISIKLQDYINSLYAFYVDEIFKDADVNTIFEFIKHYDYKKHEDVLDLYFLTPDGTAYLSNGEITTMSIEKHLGLTGKNDLFISGLCIPAGRNAKIFCIEKTIYRDGKIFGVMGCSILIDRFIEKTTGIKVGIRETYMLLDKNGFFLVHPRKEIIGRTYEPENPLYKDTSTKNLAKNPPSTVISQADDGSPIYLITTKIEESGWTIALKVSLNELNSIYIPQKRNEILIILFAICIIVALVFIEAVIFDFFQKKLLIATKYDSLTNLWTRVYFEKEANKMLKNQNSKFMLIDADVNGFKFINQNYGEAAADKLIVYYANYLCKYIKDFHSIIGKGYADHFYILIKISSVHKAMKEFKKLVENFTEDLKSYEIPFFPKFGVAFLVPSEKTKGTTIQSLIGQASFAKSTIKDNLMTQFSVYNSRLLEKINEEKFIESHMQQALEQKEFFVLYQPKISLDNEKIVGAEALVRWNSPTLGFMTPDKFIPLFERNGFIMKLDYYVYEEVFKFIQNQIKMGTELVPISLNMSRNHNKPEKFMHDFMEIFKKYSIPPKMIQIEILERSVMDNSKMQEITNMLHKEGFSVAMDDFGSGESSLNMLTKIPVDVLKFDREFLNQSTDKNGRIDKKSEKFIHILIDLSKNLEKLTVFEGVETQAQRDFLRSIKCDQAQGFFYSKPLTEDDFVEFIKRNTK